MATYSTSQDLIDRHGPNAAVVMGDEDDGARVDQACEDAGALIDTYLEPRYALPLESVPAVLVRLSTDIVHYMLGSMLAGVPVAEDDRRARHKDALALLSKIRSGEVSLGAPELGSGMPATFQAAPRRFGRDTRLM